VARLIVDTSALVAAERRRADVLELVRDDDDVAIAAVTAAELLVGVELADGRRRRQRRAFVDALLEVLSIEPYALDAARAHAALLAHVRRAGQRRGAHDLIIAATAIASDRALVTTDARGFEDLPGVRLAG
jgi:tRNA(fMet)-specific endonuclease VapC